MQDAVGLGEPDRPQHDRLGLVRPPGHSASLGQPRRRWQLRAVPRAPPGDADLVDRRAAALARLAAASVDLELVLHRRRCRRPGGGSRASVEPCRAIPCSQRRPHARGAAPSPRRHRARQPGAADGCARARAPRRRRCSRRRRRCAGRGSPPSRAPADRRASRRGRARGTSRRAARADAGVDVRIDLGRLEQQPRAEPPHVAVGDLRSVVQRDNGTAVQIVVGRGRRAGQRRLPSSGGGSGARAPTRTGRSGTSRGDRPRHALALELARDLDAVERAGQPRIGDLDTVEPASLERRREPARGRSRPRAARASSASRRLRGAPERRRGARVARARMPRAPPRPQPRRPSSVRAWTSAITSALPRRARRASRDDDADGVVDLVLLGAAACAEVDGGIPDADRAQRAT